MGLAHWLARVLHHFYVCDHYADAIVGPLRARSGIITWHFTHRGVPESFPYPCFIPLISPIFRPVGGSSAETSHGHFGALILNDPGEWGVPQQHCLCHLHQLVSTADICIAGLILSILFLVAVFYMEWLWNRGVIFYFYTLAQSFVNMLLIMQCGAIPVFWFLNRSPDKVLSI